MPEDQIISHCPDCPAPRHLAAGESKTMAAKRPNVLIDCPPSRHDNGGGTGRQRQAWRNELCCQRARGAVTLLIRLLLIAAVLTGLAFLVIFLVRQFPSEDPVYTVAITGVTGLDVLSPAADDEDGDYYSPAALSPVFNLTFHIDNTRNAYGEACVPGLSRADVSYGDAFLAGGSVPPFCAGEKRKRGPVAARAWGENAAVPQFLRDQLAAELAAGDATVDVKVTMPTPTHCQSGRCAGAVLSCKPKIGGGASAACRLDYL